MCSAMVRREVALGRGAPAHWGVSLVCSRFPRRMTLVMMSCCDGHLLAVPMHEGRRDVFNDGQTRCCIGEGGAGPLGGLCSV